jgi:hypothetical protein
VADVESEGPSYAAGGGLVDRLPVWGAFIESQCVCANPVNMGLLSAFARLPRELAPILEQDRAQLHARPVPTVPVGRARQQRVILLGDRPTCTQDERCHLRTRVVRALESCLARKSTQENILSILILTLGHVQVYSMTQNTNTNTNTKYTCDTGQTRNKLLAQQRNLRTQPTQST